MKGSPLGASCRYFLVADKMKIRYEKTLESTDSIAWLDSLHYAFVEFFIREL